MITSKPLYSLIYANEKTLAIQPGQLDIEDFRSPQQINNGIIHNGYGRDGKRSHPRIVQWNVERGYQIEKIIDILVSLDADIIALQEIDVGNARSNYIDTGRTIASHLQLHYTYICEFTELNSPLRSIRDAGGGHHGNATLSRYNSISTILFHSIDCVDWAKEGNKYKEPRIGQRIVLKSLIDTPIGKILVYNAHLEVFTGLLSRLILLQDIFNDGKKEKTLNRRVKQLILMDANTMAHGIARLSNKYCTDYMRFYSLGITESQYWRDHVLSSNILNPGYIEAFDESVTLINYNGWYSGKLDWVMMMGFTPFNKYMTNNDYKASDHKCLVVELIEGEGSSRLLNYQQNKWKRRFYAIVFLIVLPLLIAGLFKFTR